MIEQIQIARKYARMVWPYRWLSLIVAFLVAVVGSYYVFSLPPVYEVKTKIFVDTRSMLRPLMKGLAVDNNALASSASLMKRTLLTRPNLEKVAREADLDLETKTDREFDALIDGLIANIKVSGTPRESIYSIKYTDRDPQKAKKIVDELLNAFLESALGSSRTDTVVTQKFLDEQIIEYEKRLIEAEERLRDFKQRNVGMMPSQGGNYYTRLQEAKNALSSASLALSESQKRRDELNRMLSDPSQSTSSSLGGGLRTQYSDRIDALEQTLDSLTLQYTEKHPEIKGTKATLSELKIRHEAELKKLKEEASSGSVGATADNGYNQIRLALGSASAEAEALQTRVARYQSKVDELERLVDTIPEVEAELVRLDRDYGLNKSQYQALLKRRESARLSQEVDQKADNVKLKVIEPPRVPLKPSGPDRITYLSFTFLGALGFGGALAFLMSQLNPRFYSSDELKDFARIPVIGVVSLISNQRQKTERRMELAVFSTMLLGFFSLYGGFTAIELSQIDVHQKIMEVMGQ